VKKGKGKENVYARGKERGKKGVRVDSGSPPFSSLSYAFGV